MFLLFFRVVSGDYGKPWVLNGWKLVISPTISHCWWLKSIQIWQTHRFYSSRVQTLNRGPLFQLGAWCFRWWPSPGPGRCGPSRVDDATEGSLKLWGTTGEKPASLGLRLAFLFPPPKKNNWTIARKPPKIPRYLQQFHFKPAISEREKRLKLSTSSSNSSGN